MRDSKEHWLSLRTKLKHCDVRLGRATAQDYVHDPKHISFVSSRYKFAGKMLAGCGTVLEVGCGDGFGAPLVAQAVQRLICTDIDEETLADNRARLKEFSNIAFEYFDFRQAPYPAAVEGVYLIDVLEHVFPEEEDTFLDHVARSLVPHGIGLLGTPNASSEPYASAHSKTGHVNWKSGEQLRALAQRFFHNVFMFGMNDEVIHTGFLPMSHYLLALCVGPRVAR